MFIFCSALVAVPYAAKERHTSLPPPQPLVGLSLWGEVAMGKRMLLVRSASFFAAHQQPHRFNYAGNAKKIIIKLDVPTKAE